METQAKRLANLAKENFIGTYELDDSPIPATVAFLETQLNSIINQQKQIFVKYFGDSFVSFSKAHLFLDSNLKLVGQYISQQTEKQEKIKDFLLEYYPIEKVESSDEIDLLRELIRNSEKNQKMSVKKPVDAYQLVSVGLMLVKQGNLSEALECFLKAKNLGFPPGDFLYAMYSLNKCETANQCQEVGSRMSESLEKLFDQISNQISTISSMVNQIETKN